MEDVVQLREEPGYFGGCPKCGRDDAYLNARSRPTDAATVRTPESS
jgi:hypothetical protein